MQASHRSLSQRLGARPFFLGALALLIGISCKEVTGPEDSAVGLTVIAGDNQAGRVSSDLDDPIVVRVTNRSGAGVKGATVLFSPDSGSGAPTPLVATTDSTGVASVRWRLGPALGTMRLTASFADLTPVTVTATAVPDRVEVVSGDAQQTRVTGTLAQPLVVRVTDFQGRTVQGISVSFTPDSGSGTVAPALIATDAQGLARATWTLGNAAGAMRVVATVATSSPVEFSAIANQDVLNLASGGDQGARAGTTLPRPVQVRVTDQNGTPVANVIVNFEPGTGSGTVSPVSAQSNAQGIVQTNWTLGATPGAQTLTARSNFASAITVNAAGLLPTEILAVSGNQQITRVSTALPSNLVVLVTDSTGRRVPGAQVRFAPDSGSGTVDPAIATTDTLGQANTRWTLGASVGVMRLRAISGSDTLVFQATTTADIISATAGDNQTARFGTTLGTPLAVTARDLSGAAVPGVVVTFTPAAGSGSVAPTTVTTDATGVARTLWTLGAAPGPMRLTASAPTAAQTIEFRATASGDLLTVASGQNQAAAAGALLPAPVVMQVRRADGTAVSGVELTFSPSDGSVSPATATTDAAGRAQTAWTLGTAAGPQALTVSAASTLPATITATARAAASLTITGSGQTARFGAALTNPIAATLLDLDGNPVPSATITFTPDAGSGSVSAATATTNSQGRAQVTWTLGATRGDMRMTVSATGAASEIVTATASGDVLTVATGASQVAAAGTTLLEPVVMQVRRSDGTPVSGVTLSFSPSSGTVTPATATTDVNGRAQTTWTLGAAAGGQALTVTSTTTPSVTVPATSRSATTLTLAGDGQSARFSTALGSAVVATLTDDAGLPVPGATVTFTPDAGSGSVSAASVTTNAQGRAQVTWTLGSVPGSMRLTVSATGATSQFANATATGDAIVVETGNNQSALAGTTLGTAVRVRLTNASNAALANVKVAFTPALGSGTVSADTVTTDNFGRAQVTWTLGGVRGPMALNITSAVTAALSVNATALAADAITLVTAGTLSGFVSTALDSTIRVRVTDRDGANVPGVSVTFAPSGSGTVSAATVSTDANGLASTRWTLGSALGTQTLAASVSAGPTVNISATARADSSRVISIQAGNNQDTLPRAGLPSALTVRVLDRFGNAVQGQTIDWTGTNVTLSSASSTTNASGDATVSVTTGNVAGATTVRATVNGRTESVSFGVTTQVNLTSVWAGDFHTCGIDESGTAYCWGFNQQGQLGVSAVTDDMTNSMGTPVTAGSQVPRFRKISSQGIDACGITLESQLMCWGAGTGNFGQRTPTRVTFSSYATLKDVAVGSNFACVLEVGGVAWCHGVNGYGQLGSDSIPDQEAGPYPVVTERLSSIDAGLLHACGFRQGSTALYCWGYNQNGALGDGTTTSRRSATLVSGAITWDTTSLAVGGNHTCALNSAGAAFCWGSNAYGQLGDGTTVQRLAPTAVSGGFTFKKLYAGRDHTCGILTDDTAVCWGRNNAGQLGSGTLPNPANATAPTAVLDGLTFNSLSLGELHSCGVRLNASGTNNTLATPGEVRCWGDGEKGQLGNGAFSANNSPILNPARVSHQP